MTLDIFTWIFSASILHLLLGLFVSYYCLIRRREANSALFWIFLTWSFPVIGFVLFLFFGLYRLSDQGWEKHCADERLFWERQARQSQSPGAPGDQPLHDTLREALGNPPDASTIMLNQAISAITNQCPLLGGNQISLLVTGDQAYPRMLEAIAGARRHIHLQSFIIANDQVGRQFLETMAYKARQGVQVKILYDNLGCTKTRWGGLFARYRKTPNLRLAPWTQVNLFKREFQANLRNHRKILVVDGCQAFVGGINIARHNITRSRAAPIRDYHFHLRGPIVRELQYAFLRDWHFMTADPPDQLLNTSHFPTVPPGGKAAIRIINSGPTTTEMEAIANVFFSAITAASREVLVVTPYFVPFREIIQALRMAAMRGVRVRVVVPRRNNHPVVGWAGRSLYEELLRAGVEIFERQPPFMHAKAMLVDRTVAVVGTANLDACSLRLDYETNIAVFDRQLLDRLHAACEQEIKASRQINLQEWLERPTRQILLENLCGLLSPTL